MVPSPRPSPDADVVSVLPELYVPGASQWLSTSSGRIAGEGYSWMQAVHWVAGSGLYRPRRHRSHGPRSFGPTTVRVAQELAMLFPCRPGIEYLVRRTGLSERSVEYHLGMLREAGLLAYIVKGTRVRGESAQASEFARMIPVEFDVALGIRTVQRDEAAPAYTRAVSGIAETGRGLMTKLAKKAARKVRKPRSKTSPKAPARGARKGADQGSVTAVSDEVRCTPMQVGTSTVSSAGTTSLPPESKLASGVSKSPTPKKSSSKAGGRRKLNVVGRRYQLAKELTQELDWLRGCSVPRIAWVARGVADAGWTVTDVRGWLHFRGEAARVRRGSGLLATLLKDAEKILDTPAKRADAVEQWRSAQEAARRERIQQVRARQERFEGDWQAPTSRAVQQQVDAAFAAVREAASGRTPTASDQEPAAGGEEAPELHGGLAGLAGLDEDEVARARAEARQHLALGDTELIEVAIAAMGPEAAEQLYGPKLLRRAKQLATGFRSTHMTLGHR
ncbi:helix-turn-helix domain-containing protein [Streptomyces platensis]|uniref:helix-turn-helix domain-containing protein n=1 Tax=Streptomyces platensis TaxID=58346 RepID=UPI001F1D2571|nr:helix-turn-helix domain-containing protein [Streptomyces platensis]MCF3143757.1 helix-turn-helix transcriptional regulator [Streptomyces platensis]